MRSDGQQSPFDTKTYQEIDEKRWDCFQKILPQLIAPPAKVLDVGAGAGFFSGKLTELGYRVSAVEGRQENVDLIRVRYPTVEAHVRDVQDRGSLMDFSGFDAVFCAGLLYHLENPIAAIRNICALDAPIILIETQLVPTHDPIFRLVEEGVTSSQGLSYLALVPSLSTLSRLMRINGWKFVYESEIVPNHPHFAENSKHYALRKILLVSRNEIDHAKLRFNTVPDGRVAKNFHLKRGGFLGRVRRRVFGA